MNQLKIVFAICDHRLHNVDQCEMVISELLQNSKDISSTMEFLKMYQVKSTTTLLGEYFVM